MTQKQDHSDSLTRSGGLDRTLPRSGGLYRTLNTAYPDQLRDAYLGIINKVDNLRAADEIDDDQRGELVAAMFSYANELRRENPHATQAEYASFFDQKLEEALPPHPAARN